MHVVGVPGNHYVSRAKALASILREQYTRLQTELVCKVAQMAVQLRKGAALVFMAGEYAMLSSLQCLLHGDRSKPGQPHQAPLIQKSGSLRILLTLWKPLLLQSNRICTQPAPGDDSNGDGVVDDGKVCYSPKGLAHSVIWGPLRETANAAAAKLLYVLYNPQAPDLTRHRYEDGSCHWE